MCVAGTSLQTLPPVFQRLFRLSDSVQWERTGSTGGGERGREVGGESERRIRGDSELEIEWKSVESHIKSQASLLICGLLP